MRVRDGMNQIVVTVGSGVQGGFRHVIVVGGGDVVGILSMRDIVRCWTSEGAVSEVPAPAGAALRGSGAGG